MKPTRPFVLIFALIVLFTTMAPGVSHARVSFDFFYENLDPYGDWIETDDYGYVWHPSGVDEDWAPYTDGYWAYTDGGWTWVSYEDFGGITYHYGRWARIDDVGWSWIPDYEWGPAWVSWRSSDDYVGWAPLPPQCRFRRDVGISFWVDSTYDIGPGYYNFCSYRDFGSPALRHVIIDRSRNVTIINRTTNITNITMNRARNVVFNGGPNFQVASRRAARPIQTLQLVQQTDPAAFRARGAAGRARLQGNQLVVLAPEVAASEGKVKPARVARSLGKVKVDNGWNRIQDPAVRQQLQTKFRRDAKGVAPETAPARALTAGDVKVIDERVKRGAARKGKTAEAVAPDQAITAQPGVVPTPPATVSDRTKGGKGKAATTVSPDQTLTAQPSNVGAEPTPVVKPGKNKRNGRPVPTPPAQLTVAPPDQPAAGKDKGAVKRGPATREPVAPLTETVTGNAVPNQPADLRTKRTKVPQKTAEPAVAAEQQQAAQERRARQLQSQQQQQQNAEKLQQRKSEQQQTLQQRKSEQQQVLQQRRAEQQQALQQRQATVQQQRQIQLERRQQQIQQREQVQRVVPQERVRREVQVAPQPKREVAPRVVKQPAPQAVQPAPKKGKAKEKKDEESH